MYILYISYTYILTGKQREVKDTIKLVCLGHIMIDRTISCYIFIVLLSDKWWSIYTPISVVGYGFGETVYNLFGIHSGCSPYTNIKMIRISPATIC